jgi:hypothetical protein
MMFSTRAPGPSRNDLDDDIVNQTIHLGDCVFQYFSVRPGDGSLETCESEQQHGHAVLQIVSQAHWPSGGDSFCRRSLWILNRSFCRVLFDNWQTDNGHGFLPMQLLLYSQSNVTPTRPFSAQPRAATAF